MARAFPFPITIGTDICRIERIQRILTVGGPITKLPQPKKYAEKFVRRLLTEKEVSEAVSAKRIDVDLLGRQPASLQENDTLQAMSEFVGGRFAAKEAVMKAYPSLGLTFHDITIRVNYTKVRRKIDDSVSQSPAPVAIIKTTAGEEAEQEVPISISHDGNYATATALGFCNASDAEHEPDPSDSEDALEADGIVRPAPKPEPNPLKTEFYNPLGRPPPSEGKVEFALRTFTITVKGLSSHVRTEILLDFFAQRYATVRSVTIRRNQGLVGYVSFGYRNEALRATEELTNTFLLGSMVKVKYLSLRVFGLNDDGWLHNKDAPQIGYGDFVKNLSLESPSPSKDTADFDQEVEILRLSVLKNVFQDHPEIIARKRKWSEAISKALWNSEDSIRTSGWDSFGGAPVSDAELRDIVAHDELEEERQRSAKKAAESKGNKPVKIRAKKPVEMEEEEEPEEPMTKKPAETEEEKPMTAIQRLVGATIVKGPNIRKVIGEGRPYYTHP